MWTALFRSTYTSVRWSLTTIWHSLVMCMMSYAYQSLDPQVLFLLPDCTLIVSWRVLSVIKSVLLNVSGWVSKAHRPITHVMFGRDEESFIILSQILQVLEEVNVRCSRLECYSSPLDDSCLVSFIVKLFMMACEATVNSLTTDNQILWVRLVNGLGCPAPDPSWRHSPWHLELAVW